MQPKLIDWAKTVALLHGDQHVAKEIMIMFFEELPELQRLINEAVKNNHAEMLYKHLHKLHGSCCFVSVPALKKITHEFAVAAKHGQHEQFATLLSQFNPAADAVNAASKNFQFPEGL